MTTYRKFANKNFEKLDLYTTAITRAHGKNHPEAFEVRDLFEQIQEKTRAGNLDVSAEFNRLRQVTNEYTVPDDVCETYAAVYSMLSEADVACQKISKT